MGNIWEKLFISISPKFTFVVKKPNKIKGRGKGERGDGLTKTI